MAGPVPSAVALSEQYGEGWRVEPDPHEAHLIWRCRAFQFEFQWLPGSFMGFFGGCWYSRDVDETGHPRRPGFGSCCTPTPEREAMWTRLFLKP